MRKIWVLIAISGLFLAACNNTETKSAKTSSHTLFTEGEAQGTTYHITYVDTNDRKLSTEFDSIFKMVDQSLSLWDTTSLIYHINTSEDLEIIFDDEAGFFSDNFRISRQISNWTQGAFDPTVGALAGLWGFGKDSVQWPSEERIAEEMKYVGFGYEDIRLTKLEQEGHFARVLKRNSAHQRLDFNAIAQGYTVDVIAAYLEYLGINSYLVEVGGEIKVNGNKENGDKWVIGIDKPVAEEKGRPLQKKLQFGIDKAIATSGNYRKFYVKDGKKYPHTIDPRTGMPVTHQLLSATVIADNCAMADAMATAFMVMGDSATQQFVIEHPELDLAVYLISDAGDGEFTEWNNSSFIQYVKE